MEPFSSGEFTVLIITLMGLAWLIYRVPSCGETKCVEAHRGHMVSTRAEAIEKEHATFHDRLRPQPLCALCQARKRDEPEP